MVTRITVMQCGFAMLEAGATRAKNTKNILMKVRLVLLSEDVPASCPILRRKYHSLPSYSIIPQKTLNATLGYLVYWAVGYAFSFGQGSTQNGFIGLDEFFLYDTSRFAFFFFQVCC